MSTVSVPGQPGKYWVLFDGVEVPCISDVDCPGAGICAVNQTWATQPGGWCMCYSRAGLDGDSCSSICPIGQMRLGIAVIVMLASVVVAVLSLAAFLSQCRRNARILAWPNALSVTLFSIGVGSVLFIVYHIMMLATTLGFPSNYVIVPSRNGYLRRVSQQAEYATFILLVLAQCVSAIAPLALPLVWLDMTHAVFNFRPRSVHAVHFLSIGFCCIVCFVQFPLYVLAANNFQGGVVRYGDTAAIIWYVVYGFIIFVNLAAAIRTMVAKVEVRSRPRSEPNVRFLGLLNKIFRVAVALMIIYACVIGLIVGAQARQQRTYYNDPTCNVVNGSVYTLSDMCLRLACAAIVAGSVVCLWFVFPDVAKLISSSSEYGAEPNDTYTQHTRRIAAGAANPAHDTELTETRKANTASNVNSMDSPQAVAGREITIV